MAINKNRIHGAEAAAGDEGLGAGEIGAAKNENQSDGGEENRRGPDH
jgi:hypothetical protein